jgi:hypothetical protein
MILVDCVTGRDLLEQYGQVDTKKRMTCVIIESDNISQLVHLFILHECFYVRNPSGDVTLNELICIFIKMLGCTFCEGPTFLEPCSV